MKGGCCPCPAGHQDSCFPTYSKHLSGNLSAMHRVRSCKGLRGKILRRGTAVKVTAASPSSLDRKLDKMMSLRSLGLLNSSTSLSLGLATGHSVSGGSAPATTKIFDTIIARERRETR
mmetsp:Transcript_22136/g.50248  ORF Transcript_22136/g.50248 Transcript_22136/m.50248 type:complete len:118 (+) Transcript_22136:469-822(+)